MRAMKTFTLLHGIIALFATSIAGATTHVVKSGDNLYRIAQTYNVSLSALQQANPGVNAQSLSVGRQITIPTKTTPAAKQSSPKPETRPLASGTYTVAAGDSLSKIARSQGTTVSALQAANPKLDATALRVGQKINLGGKTSAAVAKAPTARTPAAKTPTPSVASATSEHSTSSRTEAKEKSSTPTANKNAVASSTVAKEPVARQTAKSKEMASVEKTPANSPAASLTADSTQPISHQKKTETAASSYVLIKTTREQTLAEVAAEHATTPEKLNALNGWSFSPQTLLAVDSELYVPAQP
jgi:LysM repeat protein